jgi:type II secretory pathway pseudopilin PulG
MTRSFDYSARPGFALPSAIIVLVLLSTLIVGTLFVATEELRSGRSDVADQRALAAAEWALERAALGWDAQRNSALGIGERVELGVFTDEGDSVRAIATRVARRAVWIAARATSFDGRAIPARRVVGGSFRLVGPNVSLAAALTSGGTVTVVTGGVVSGRDSASTVVSARSCAGEPRADAAGVAVPDSAGACGATCATTPPVGVDGAPPVTLGPGANDPAFSTFGDESRASLAQRATVVLGAGTYVSRPVVVANACVVSDPLNWGDPSGESPCGDHFPVVHVRGDAVLAAGAVGQGVLLVDGDLTLEAGARFAGIVVVADDVVVRGPGADISGVVLAANADGVDGTRVEHGGAVRFGSCVARAASLGTARLERTPGRWWAELR